MTTQIELIGNQFAGYGHRTLTILVDGVRYSATTSNMRMTDNLNDDTKLSYTHVHAKNQCVGLK